MWLWWLSNKKENGETRVKLKSKNRPRFCAIGSTDFLSKQRPAALIKLGRSFFGSGSRAVKLNKKKALKTPFVVYVLHLSSKFTYFGSVCWGGWQPVFVVKMRSLLSIVNSIVLCVSFCRCFLGLFLQFIWVCASTECRHPCAAMPPAMMYGIRSRRKVGEVMRKSQKGTENRSETIEFAVRP